MNREEKMFLAFRYLVNKMLKPYNVDFDYIVANPTIEEKKWFEYYTWDNSQRKLYFKEASLYVQGILHYSKKQSQQVVMNFLSNNGLKIK